MPSLCYNRPTNILLIWFFKIKLANSFFFPYSFIYICMHCLVRFSPLPNSLPLPLANSWTKLQKGKEMGIFCEYLYFAILKFTRIYRLFLCHTSFLNGILIPWNEEISIALASFPPIIWNESCDMMLLARFSLSCVLLKRKFTFDVSLLRTHQRFWGICTSWVSAKPPAT